MQRRRLPNRRDNESFQFTHGGMRFTASAGYFRDGRLAEVFLSSAKPGSAIEDTARDGAILISLALQYGADLAGIRAALTMDHDGSPATVIGAALRTLGSET